MLAPQVDDATLQQLLTAQTQLDAVTQLGVVIIDIIGTEGTSRQVTLRHFWMEAWFMCEVIYIKVARERALSLSVFLPLFLCLAALAEPRTATSRFVNAGRHRGTQACRRTDTFPAFGVIAGVLTASPCHPCCFAVVHGAYLHCCCRFGHIVTIIGYNFSSSNASEHYWLIKDSLPGVGAGQYWKVRAASIRHQAAAACMEPTAALMPSGSGTTG